MKGTNSFASAVVSLWGGIALPKLCDLAEAAPIRLYQIKLQVRNEAPNPGGTCVTPIWYGIHDGSFDSYDEGTDASAALERMAEDGNAQPLSELFLEEAAASPILAEGLFGSEPLCPGDGAVTKQWVFNIPPDLDTAIYFSYVAMVLPSNDAFVANDNPFAHELISKRGRPARSQDFDVVVMGSEVKDAGTEVNDEVPRNTAFFGQRNQDSGNDENGVVVAHEGFLPVGEGGILDSDPFANADFTAPRYRVLSVRLLEAPRVNSVVRAFLDRDTIPPFDASSTSKAFGRVSIRITNPDGTMRYRVRLTRLVSPATSIRILVGSNVEDAISIFDFVADQSQERRSSDNGIAPIRNIVLLKGTIEPGEFSAGFTTEKFWNEALNVNAFVEVATVDFRQGEIRGFFPKKKV